MREEEELYKLKDNDGRGKKVRHCTLANLVYQLNDS